MSQATSEKLPTETIERAKSADLYSLAERTAGQLRRNAHHDWQATCPKCGDDCFHIYQAKSGVWRFRCYTCHDEPGDTIEFMRWLQPGLSFAEAVAQLAGGALPAAAVKRQQAPKAPPAKVQAADWRRRAERLAADARVRLWGADGEPARVYLERRGLESHVWLTYQLGYVLDAAVPGTEGKQRAPAIALPWISAAAGIYGIRFRFLEPQGEYRLTSYSGSDFTNKLYGGQALPESCFAPVPDGGKPAESLCTLLIVEGEINAMSCYQVGHETRLDVLSIGSESANLSPAGVAFAQRYRRVMVWADRANVAQRIMGALPGAYGVRSPGGKDANDLLRDGLLGGFLAAIRADAARNAHELEGLLWDLWDASLLLNGIDTSTAAMVGELAKKLGRQARLIELEPNRWIAEEKCKEWGL